LLASGSEIGLRGPVWSAFEALVQHQSGLFGQSRKRCSRKFIKKDALNSGGWHHALSWNGITRFG
jgi:hypothetical protein